jgi:hypothetical protein
MYRLLMRLLDLVLDINLKRHRRRTSKETTTR